MALAPRLDIRPSQGLTLTPQLMQSIRLLQLSHIELEAFVEAELTANPLLERAEGEADFGPDPEELAPETGAEPDLLPGAERMPSAETLADGLDTDVESLFPEQAGPDGQGREGYEGGPIAGRERGEGAADFEQFTPERPSLADHLGRQVGLILVSPAERIVARHLIDGLDEAGYLGTGLDAIADELGADVAMVEAVLLKVQGCEPVGVFARSVAECLAIQLKERDRLDPLMARFLDHLDLVARHELAALGRAVGASQEDLTEMLAEIRALDPRPGLAFESGPIPTVVPDVFVRRAASGGWGVELNGDILPKVLVNRRYYAEIDGRTRDPADHGFLTECLASANWLVRSLEQRAQTILRVATEMMRQQEEFLVHGVSRLRPMTLRTVADAIGMHESTVSRVTANKYLATPRGLYEMKYFFTTALGSSAGGEDHSAEAVRHRIRQMVEAEPPEAVLSDDTIARVLQDEQGIAVARRTVAKYREGMNIPSSAIRRRRKRALALTP